MPKSYGYTERIGENISRLIDSMDANCKSKMKGETKKFLITYIYTAVKEWNSNFYTMEVENEETQNIIKKGIKDKNTKINILPIDRLQY
jgi:hypothetical protein